MVVIYRFIQKMQCFFFKVFLSDGCYYAESYCIMLWFWNIKIFMSLVSTGEECEYDTVFENICLCGEGKYPWKRSCSSQGNSAFSTSTWVKCVRLPDSRMPWYVLKPCGSGRIYHPSALTACTVPVLMQNIFFLFRVQSFCQKIVGLKVALYTAFGIFFFKSHSAFKRTSN